MVRIVTDSSADITQAEAKQLGITVMPLTINFGEQSFLDGVDISQEEFYSRLVNGNIHPTTSQASPLQYEQLYEEARNAGDTVILLPISQRISGSHNCAHMVKNQGNYDNVYIVDTLATVSYLRILVLEALAQRDNMPPQQLVEHLEQMRPHIKLYAVIDTLAYLLKGGRVSKTSAALGCMLHVKPIISVIEGEVKVIGKAIGVKKGIAFLVSKFCSADIDRTHPILFGYADIKDRAMELIDKAIPSPEERQCYKDKLINLSPIVGVHTGANVAVVTFVEKY